MQSPSAKPQAPTTGSPRTAYRLLAPVVAMALGKSVALWWTLRQAHDLAQPHQQNDLWYIASVHNELAPVSLLARQLRAREANAQDLIDWTIVHAGSGEEALQQVRESPVDLVSMDFNMHGMNGPNAALALRQLLPRVPIAILTANVQNAVQERIEEAGMVFIAKPITAQAAQQLAALAGA